MNPTLLRLQHIDFSYHTLHGETKALSDVSFTVTEGDYPMRPLRLRQIDAPFHDCRIDHAGVRNDYLCT